MFLRFVIRFRKHSDSVTSGANGAKTKTNIENVQVLQKVLINTEIDSFVT
jgi:hypothetical protein